MIKIRKLFNDYFSNLETSLKSIIFILIPFAVFFSVLSDRSPYNYFNLIVYGFLSIAIISYVFKYKSFKFDIFPFLILLFNFTILVSQIVNMRVGEYPRSVVLLSLFSIIIYQFFINIDNKQNVFTAILVGGLIFAVFFIFYYRNEIIKLEFSERIGRDFSDQNDLAKYISVFCVLSIGMLFKSKRILRVGFAVATFIFLVLILFTGSISNLLCIVLTLIFVAIYKTKRQNRLFIILGIAATIGLFVLLLQLPVFEYFKKRIEGIFAGLTQSTSAKKDGSAIDRFTLFQEALRLFATRPLFGFGYDQVQYYTHGAGMFSHNNFTELAASFGIFGFFVFEVLLLMPLVKSIREKKIDSQSLFLIFYLFIFQFFLIIFRKKIEFVLMPLFFSISCFGYYPYFEAKFENRKFVLSFVKSAESQNEKITVSKKKNKVLHLFSPDDFSINHCDEIKNNLSSDCDFIDIAVVKPDFESSGNETYQIYKTDARLFKLRKLSFEIDKINPDVVYVDSQTLTNNLLECIGISRKTICYLRNDFNEAKICKRKRIQYIAFNLDTKTRFEDLSKKKKYHATFIENSFEKDDRNFTSFNKRKYASIFLGSTIVEDDYKEVVERFVSLHERDSNMRFAISANENAYAQLEKYFEKESIDFIDLYHEDVGVKDAITNSKCALLLSNNVIDDKTIKVLNCSQTIGVRKETINSTLESNNFTIECKETKINDFIYEIFTNEVERNAIRFGESKDIDLYFLQYQYMKVFVL